MSYDAYKGRSIYDQRMVIFAISNGIFKEIMEEWLLGTIPERNQDLERAIKKLILVRQLIPIPNSINSTEAPDFYNKDINYLISIDGDNLSTLSLLAYKGIINDNRVLI